MLLLLSYVLALLTCMYSLPTLISTPLTASTSHRREGTPVAVKVYRANGSREAIVEGSWCNVGGVGGGGARFREEAANAAAAAVPRL